MPVFEKVLLVEDDPITILVCKRTIEIAGFANEVKSVVNGQEAIDYLKDTTLQPDLILLDLNMPILKRMGVFRLVWHLGNPLASRARHIHPFIHCGPRGPAQGHGVPQCKGLYFKAADQGTLE